MPTVLIVDDEPDILLLLRLALRQAGYSTLEATNGQQAVEMVAEHGPDVVILDIMMPLVDGWTALERIHARPASPAVIVLTARAAPRERDRAEALGAVEFLTKPVEPKALIEGVERALATRTVHRPPTNSVSVASTQPADG